MRGYHRPPATRHTAEAVRTQVQKWLDDNPGNGKYDLNEVTRRVNMALNGGQHEWHEPTDRQIYRAVEKLAGEGTLIKVPRDKTGPDGRVDGRSPTYYTPAGFEAARVKYEAEQAERAAERARWKIIYDTLAGWGLDPKTSGRFRSNEPGQPVVLTVGNWEVLLGLAPGVPCPLIPFGD